MIVEFVAALPILAATPVGLPEDEPLWGRRLMGFALSTIRAIFVVAVRMAPEFTPFGCAVVQFMHLAVGQMPAEADPFLVSGEPSFR